MTTRTTIRFDSGRDRTRRAPALMRRLLPDSETLRSTWSSLLGYPVVKDIVLSQLFRVVCRSVASLNDDRNGSWATNDKWPVSIDEACGSGSAR
jgi:hypothetical protein